MRPENAGSCRSKQLVICLLVLAIVCACRPGAFADTVLDFEELGSSAWVLVDHYRGSGVLLSTDADSIRSGWGQGAHSGITHIYGSVATLAEGNIIADFVLPGTDTPGRTSTASFWVADADWDNSRAWSAAAYDAGGNLLDSTQGYDATQVTFNSSTAGIHRIVFTPSTDMEGMDDLAFGNIEAVPEPATLSLVALALGALPLLRRGK